MNNASSFRINAERKLWRGATPSVLIDRVHQCNVALCIFYSYTVLLILALIRSIHRAASFNSPPVKVNVLLISSGNFLFLDFFSKSARSVRDIGWCFLNNRETVDDCRRWNLFLYLPRPYEVSLNFNPTDSNEFWMDFSKLRKWILRLKRIHNLQYKIKLFTNN